MSLNMPKFTSFLDVMRYRAAADGNKTAFTFVEPTGAEQNISYRDLDRAVRSVACGLQGKAKPGARVLILLPPGIDYVISFLACIAAGVIAVPAYPPTKSKTNNGIAKLINIAKDAGAEFVLANTEIVTLAKMAFFVSADFRSVTWLSCEKLQKANKPEAWREPKLDPNGVAFLQYTSGSTGNPKGVMVTHANLIHNSHLIQIGTANTRDSYGVSWLPPYHDMGLITGILQPLYAGFGCSLMSPLTFIKDPFLWLKTISDKRATASGGPNFAYDLCCKVIPDEKLAGLDFSNWQIAFTGAEPIKQASMDRFSRKLAPFGFNSNHYWPCYGLAEGTLIVSGAPLTANRVKAMAVDAESLQENRVTSSVEGKHSATLVASGISLEDVKVRLAHPDSGAAIDQDRSVGEIWVSGPSVAQGYWNNPDLTKEVFHAGFPDEPGKRYLRTGDLGFYDKGELFITGRLKDLIIVNGHNHYPHDLELTAEQADKRLRAGQAAAFSIEKQDGEGVVLLFEADASQPDYDPESIINNVRQAIASGHELALHDFVILPPRSILKTTSGKIRRQACKAAYLRGDFNKWAG